MEDLLQSQIKDSCKLAMPEGLRDLMSDISREVLRARPQNLYQFIADYLAAMLVARETLTIAGHVCKGVCNCGCEPELDDELRDIGLTQDEAEEAKNIIIRYLEKDKVKEEILMAKLLRSNIDQQKLPSIQKAVKAAYKRNLRRLTFFKGSSDDVTRAAKHTLELYWKSGSLDRKHSETNDEQPPFYDKCQKHYQTEASSSNSSQYKNSSLTSLAGSYMTPLISKEKPTKEQLVIPSNENGPKVHKIIEKKQVHIETENDQVINEIDEEIVKDDKIDFGDGELENVDDEVLYADDESDISVAEDIIEE